MGHETVICKNRNQPHSEATKVVDPEEEYLFAATGFSSIESSQNWLIDSGCTNHMTNNKDLFKEQSIICILKVRVGDGKFIRVNGKGTVAISTNKGTKLIFDVLYVTEID
ncbi:hypothetical protein GmHk_07G019149 [Glycine max]|nr:hypothetical protein GmHk_07G019149 [Glycine max]